MLAGIQQTSTEFAFAAAALGLVFAGAVLLITRKKVAADVDIYRATGLPALLGLPPPAQVSLGGPPGVGGRGGGRDRSGGHGLRPRRAVPRRPRGLLRRPPCRLAGLPHLHVIFAEGLRRQVRREGRVRGAW